MELNVSYESVLKAIKDRPVVWIIMLISCVPFIILSQHNLFAISHWFMPTRFEDLLNPFSIWRLWTPTFVHYTLGHLATNLFLWWYFASKVEIESRSQLILLLIVSAAVADLCQWWIVGANFGGLSGVVYALMAYCWILGRFAGKLNYQFDNLLAILMLLLIPLGFTGKFGLLASYAHIGGLISGILLALFYLVLKRKQLLN